MCCTAGGGGAFTRDFAPSAIPDAGCPSKQSTGRTFSIAYPMIPPSATVGTRAISRSPTGPRRVGLFPPPGRCARRSSISSRNKSCVWIPMRDPRCSGSSSTTWCCAVSSSSWRPITPTASRSPRVLRWPIGISCGRGWRTNSANTVARRSFSSPTPWARSSPTTCSAAPRQGCRFIP
ncbi:MAG: hypothetical protein BWY77_01962 [bacterium ADurb.Bin431]|nr:MAG: hypothetical protein BWY77_01962 [bacterium ADurb.Bin431]